MRLETHTHTYYSHRKKVLYDGVNSPEEMVKQAKRNGIDAIAITDHDTMEAVERAKKAAKKTGIEVIPGEEVSTLNGHMVAVNIQEAVPPRLSVMETLDKVHEQGGIGISSHPFDILREGLGEYAKHCDAMEVFNPLNMDRIANIKARRFSKKYGIPMVTGSDAHYTKMLNHGVIEADADSIDGAIRQIRKNSVKLHTRYFSLATMRELVVRRLTMSYDYTLNYMNANYSWPKRMIGKRLLNAAIGGNHERAFKAFSYFALGGVVLYSGFKTVMEL